MNDTIYAVKLPDLLLYTAPEPSPEQFANAKARGFDPYDRLGSGIINLSASQILTAAAVLHDILYVRGGSEYERLIADNNFERDCFVLAKASNSNIELVKAFTFSQVVHLLSREYWEPEDRNSVDGITWQQEMVNGCLAQRWINACARKINDAAPYAQADFGQYVGI